MGYSAGNLELSILGFSDKAVGSIDVTTKALRRLASTVDKIAKSDFYSAGNNLEHLFSRIAKSTNSINTTNIENLASAAKHLSSITRIGNLEKMDFAKVGKGFENLSIAIQPFLDKVKQAEASLTALEGVLRRTSGKKIQGLLGGGATDNKKGSFFGFAKLGVNIYLMRRLGRLVENIVQSGANYTETLNLWETSMGDNLNVATQFVNKMNEAYGISEKTLMNAQAIFKNMLGSLGQISDQMAYSLSEGITQMALDYASLYNVSFQDAFTKFQAALAGQVRPIRSVSGYDITETTLFQLYQSLGGEKTMRQLNRTEKQLLSILAVFRQMDASGAVGDLEKTMSSFANQSRVWAESFGEVKTWLGVILSYTIQESGIMIKLNAVLITVARYLEAVARSIGAIQSFGGADPFAGTEQSAQNASDAIDELNGKLLDFDKFRSLNGSQENAIGLDEKLLSALSGYDTILGNASLEARELSDQWLKALGFNIDANGELVLTNEQLNRAKDKLQGIISTLKQFDGLATLQAIFPLLSTFLNFLKEVAPAIVTISTALTPIFTQLLNITANIVTLLDQLGLLEVAIALIISYKIGARIISAYDNIVKLVGVVGKLYNNIGKQLPLALDTATNSITKMNIAYSALTGIMSYMIFSGLLSSLSDEARGIVAPIMAWVGAITALAAAYLALHGIMTWGTALPLLMAGVGASIAGLKASLAVENFAEGGNPDKGTIFRAGEAGAEIVYNAPSGQSGVANVKQIKQAHYEALTEWGDDYLAEEFYRVRSTISTSNYSNGGRGNLNYLIKEANKYGYNFRKV